VFLSVLSMVLFGGEVLHGFSLALLIGITFGTYSSIAIASPIMVWWEQRLEIANRSAAVAANRDNQRATGSAKRVSATTETRKQSRGAGRA
jgi:preprotein translocase subunit SecF